MKNRHGKIKQNKTIKTQVYGYKNKNKKYKMQSRMDNKNRLAKQTRYTKGNEKLKIKQKKKIENKKKKKLL